jgi:DNA modification methylase
VTVRILTGDCRDVLATLPAESVQCCVTSPPYFGLRDYGTATWDGGDHACDHRMPASGSTQNKGNNNREGSPFAGDCGKCGARRIDAQIGLEPTPDAYVAEMVAVFREVRRVLRADGTCWLNIGDSYSGNGQGFSAQNVAHKSGQENTRRAPSGGCKQKDLIGIPWLLAFALRADGWYLRQEIIWHKPNPMPESVTDRCTKAHESVFLLTKSARYYFDAKAIAEDTTTRPQNWNTETHRYSDGDVTGLGAHHGLTSARNQDTRNKRSVWTIATQPYSGSHFATMPPELAETCIKAGTSEKGQCPHCGAPWARVVDVESRPNADNCNSMYGGYRGVSGGVGNDRRERTDRGWAPSCACPAHESVPQMVLDPFGGAGTTALVADRLQRDCTIIELNPEYAALARNRINDEAGLFAPVAAE